MKKLLISDSNDSLEIFGKSISNLHMEIVYKYTTLDEGTNTNVNLSALNIQTEIKQGSKEYPFTTFALPSHLDYVSRTHILTGLADNKSTSALATTQYLGHTIDDDGTNTTRSVIVPIYKHDLNLSKGEGVTVNVQQLSGLFGANVDTSSIYICYDEITDVKQPYLQIPKYVPLNSSVSEVLRSLNYADNISLVGFKTLVSSTFLCSSININSKFMNSQNDINDLLKHKNSKCVQSTFVVPIIDLKGSSYLKNVDIKLDVLTSNVTSNHDFLVYDEIIPSQSLFTRFADKLEKYEASKTDDLLEFSTDCKC